MDVCQVHLWQLLIQRGGSTHFARTSNYSPFEVKALMNTAVDLKEARSVFEVGSGRIDAYRAVHADTAIEVIDKTSNIVNDEEVDIEEKQVLLHSDIKINWEMDQLKIVEKS